MKRGAARQRRTKAARARINFIPNDPVAVTGLAIRIVAPRPDRGGRRATFDFGIAPAPPGRYAPGTPEFLYWQAREAALAAVETFEEVAGPLRSWAPGARSPLQVVFNAGVDLNAYYDRTSLSFFEDTARGVTTYTGASTDVVAHEAGHAFLDAMRPDLWDSALPEHAAFHEAFGDCVAILTALSDAQTRNVVARRLNLTNPVEAMMEGLAAGVRRRYGRADPSSEPRHAFNRYEWQLPSTLPASGGPTVLTGEAHSFARVFTGCFYDTIRNIFDAHPSRTAATLRRAAQTAGTLLIEGTKKAVEGARFFRSVGEAMLAADRSLHAGNNQNAILAAFDRHGIALAPPARAFQDRMRLVGGVSAAGRAAGGISPAVITGEVRRRLNVAPTARIDHSDLWLGGFRNEKFVHRREVPLGGLSERLANVVAIAPEPVVVGGMRRGYAALRSSVPERTATEDEVRYFVEMLLERNAIAFSDAPAPTRGRGAVGHGGVAPAGFRRALGRPTAARATPGEADADTDVSTPSSGAITHVVRVRGGKQVLTRIRFACASRESRVVGRRRSE